MSYDVVIVGARCAGAATALDLVIGADGRRSTVARLARARVTHRAPASSTVIYRYFRDARAAGYHWYYAAGSASGVIPTNDELVCVFAATSAERPWRELDGSPDTRFRRLVTVTAPELADRLANCPAVGPPRVFPGLTGYLRDAAILARAITAAGPDAVRHYQAERDELWLRLFRVTGRIASFEWTADEIGDHLLEVKDAMAEEVAAMTDPDQPLQLVS